MSLSFLQRLSLGFFSTVRRGLDAVRDWLDKRPTVATWIYPAGQHDYREHNGRMFANFHEQERMLADKARMAFYHSAIARHIQPGDRVIDLGTGTGILAALSARRGASHVYAIDHSKILEHARSLARANRIENVEFISAHSTDFTLTEPVDVIVHEQMGDCLFDEAMVANVTDLRDRLLKPGGLILPSVFEFYCEPIKINDARLVPFIWELEVHGYDYASLERHRPQDPAYYHLVSSDLNLVEHFLGTAEPVLTIDLHTLIESELPTEIAFSRTVVNPGRMDGYAVFFRARVDDDLSLSSSPLDRGRAPHWGFRILRADREDFVAGDRIDARLSVGRWTALDTWRWSQTRRAADELSPVG